MNVCGEPHIFLLVNTFCYFSFGVNCQFQSQNHNIPSKNVPNLIPCEISIFTSIGFQPIAESSYTVPQFIH